MDTLTFLATVLPSIVVSLLQANVAAPSDATTASAIPLIPLARMSDAQVELEPLPPLEPPDDVVGAGAAAGAADSVLVVVDVALDRKSTRLNSSH